MAQSASSVEVQASPASNQTGYRSFRLGSFAFSRDEYFVHIAWQANGQKLSHTISADAFQETLFEQEETEGSLLCGLCGLLFFRSAIGEGA